MQLLRRVVALAMFASLTGSQPVAASCAMVPDGVDAEAAAVGAHAHHAADVPAPADPSPAQDESNSESCGLMMACTVGAPTLATAMVPIGAAGSDSAVAVPSSGRSAPVPAFEPPPPRHDLI